MNLDCTKITVIGLGYVGLTTALLFENKFNVYGVDINEHIVNSINNSVSPNQLDGFVSYFSRNKVNILASMSYDENIIQSAIIFIALPTNYVESSGNLNTKEIEKVLSFLSKNNYLGNVVIRSTVSFGFCDSMKKSFKNLILIFWPEFLREVTAVFDSFHPSRIVLGGDDDLRLKKFAELLTKILKIAESKIFIMKYKEAESVKLFSNTYLAMRLAFFNELDTFSRINSLDTKKIIDGVSSDDRIGAYYNHPSFGFAGYCLPKDTKHLEKSFHSKYSKLIPAISKSNLFRSEYLYDCIKQKLKGKKGGKIGIFRLVSDEMSINYKNSILYLALENLKSLGSIYIYEPLLEVPLNGTILVNSYNDLALCDVIIADKFYDLLSNFKDKLLCFDVFKED